MLKEDHNHPGCVPWNIPFSSHTLHGDIRTLFHLSQITAKQHRMVNGDDGMAWWNSTRHRPRVMDHHRRQDSSSNLEEEDNPHHKQTTPSSRRDTKGDYKHTFHKAEMGIWDTWNVCAWFEGGEEESPQVSQSSKQRNTIIPNHASQLVDHLKRESLQPARVEITFANRLSGEKRRIFIL